MPKTLLKPVLLAGAVAALFPGLALSNPIIQAIPAVGGGAQTIWHPALGMSLSGRYILLPDNTSVRDMTLRDIKTQTTTALPLKVSFTSDHYAISPNGRYVSYAVTNPATQRGRGMVFDRVTQSKVDILVNDESRSLSDYGWVALRDQINGAGMQLFNTRTLSTQVISASGMMNIPTVRNDLSGDARITLYTEAGQHRLYDSVLQQNFVFNPVRSNGAPLSVRTHGSVIALASSGKYLALKGDDINDPNDAFLYRANLVSGSTHTLDRFDLGAHFVTVENGLSISGNGRFISFRGQLLPGHSEFAAVQAAGLTQPHRIFRYDTAQNQLITVSITRNGGPLRNQFSQFPGSATVQDSSITSDDGSMVSFATDADTMVTTTPTDSRGVQNYHAYLGNGYARNYLFVDMPNTDNGWKAVAPMALVADNQWEGKLTFDGVGSESFKFDVGGRIVNGSFQATPDWAINFGTGNTPGVGNSNGGNIPIPGAGTYDISFNDQTLAYSINPASEFRLQHVGGRCVTGLGESLNPANDTALVFGSSCVNQPQRRFRLLPNKSLQQVSSGLCVHPLGGSINPQVGTPLVLWSQCDDGPGNKKLAFEFTAGGSLRHVNSGLCIHPQGGSPTPGANTQLVLWSSCDEPRLGISKR